MSYFKKYPFFKLILAFLSLYLATTLYANDNTPIENLSFTQMLNDKRELNLDTQGFTELKTQLWQKYVKQAESLSALKTEYNGRALTLGDKVMRFSLEKRGNMPKDGYPLYIALHGGGNGSSGLNDGQWYAMKTYYRDSVKEGIYVAPRGISNNWNLHFEQESYPLYDKLIESAILFDNVDPNRVYFVGFSAGGDGVYAVVTRMPERFAAANMSAGHSNHLTFDNLYNTPFAMQVGERDSAYNRNHVTVENYIAMNDLREKYQGGYLHDVFVHVNGSHNSWRDNDANRRSQTVMANPIAWLKTNDRSSTALNTNAIDWMSQYTREATPTKLVWDLKVAAKLRAYQTGAALLAQEGDSDAEGAALAKPVSLFYWLDVSVADAMPSEGKLVVEADKAANTIKVTEVSGVEKFRILLNPTLVNFAEPVKVEIAGKVVGSVAVKQKLSTMARTLLERSDVNEIYDAEIVMAYDKGADTWKVS